MLKLKIAFINPPHADWSLVNNLTYLLCQSHYTRYGKYSKNVEWLPAPYKWDMYQTIDEVIEEIQTADIILFSSYVWNYDILDNIAKTIKNKNSNKITVLGGPHIGTNDNKFLESRIDYDFICQPTKPGEVFVEDLIDSWFTSNGKPNKKDVSWELQSEKNKTYLLDINYSVYEEHEKYLTEILNYAYTKQMEPFIVLETTRGCPYKCVFCEWGGGIGTKIYKKPLDIVKRDILAMIKCGYTGAYLTDANFGAFEERDLEIFEFAWNNKFSLTDISTVKSKDLNRRKKLIDSWFNIVGSDIRIKNQKDDKWNDLIRNSIVPTVSIQSISDEAMKVAERIDLSFKDKIKLSEHIKNRCEEFNFPVPALELILGMPGSTIQDFYDEMEIIWNFKAWGSYRHDYMFLPDSRLNDKVYKEKYNIKTVKVYSDIVDEAGSDSWNTLYKNKVNYFETIKSCYSFTEDDIKEMWFMNNAGNFLIKNCYHLFETYITPGDFAKLSFNIIKQLDDFIPIQEEIDDIFDQNSKPRSIRMLLGKFRIQTIEELLINNLEIIKSEVMASCLV